MTNQKTSFLSMNIDPQISAAIAKQNCISSGTTDGDADDGRVAQEVPVEQLPLVSFVPFSPAMFINKSSP